MSPPPAARSTHVCMRSSTSRLDSYAVTITCFQRERERERSALMPEGFIPLSSPCMCRAPFPGLHASAFDPVSWAWLSSTGHHESLGSGFSAGSAGKKPGPQREVRPKNSNPCPLGREDRLLIRAYQAVVGYMDSGL